MMCRDFPVENRPAGIQHSDHAVHRTDLLRETHEQRNHVEAHLSLRQHTFTNRKTSNVHDACGSEMYRHMQNIRVILNVPFSNIEVQYRKVSEAMRSCREILQGYEVFVEAQMQDRLRNTKPYLTLGLTAEWPRTTSELGKQGRKPSMEAETYDPYPPQDTSFTKTQSPMEEPIKEEPASDHEYYNYPAFVPYPSF